MARRLNTRDASFAQDFETLLFAKRAAEEDVAAGARAIIAEVRSRGDDALVVALPPHLPTAHASALKIVVDHVQ